MFVAGGCSVANCRNSGKMSSLRVSLLRTLCDMLDLLQDRWTLLLTVAAILSLVSPYLLWIKRKPLLTMLCLVASWQTASVDSVLWIVNYFRVMGNYGWPKEAAETYNVLIAAPLSLVLPLLVSVSPCQRFRLKKCESGEDSHSLPLHVSYASPILSFWSSTFRN